MRSAIISELKEIATISNSNLKRNTNILMCKENISEDSIEWIEDVKRSIPEKFKLIY